MFYVKMDDLTLWSPIDNKLKIVSPTLKLEVNKIGSLSFKIYPDHAYYSRLEKMKSIISVHQGERTLFKGRVYSDNMDFHKVKKVEVEGLLGYFNDSVVRPYDFSGSVEAYFTMLVNQHNEQVTDAQKFKIGIVTVTDPNNYITRASSNTPKTWDEINEKLIKLLGGYISIRYEADGNYVDYLADYTDVSTQDIAFSVNLLDLNLENKANSLATCIIPYGAKDNATGKKIDIKSVNGGLDYIYDADAVARYGRIFEVVTWEDVTLPSNLLSKARLYLSEKVRLLSKLTVKAIDLHLTDETIEAFKLGDYVKVYSNPHGIDERVLLTAYSMDLTNPSGCTITLGLEKSGYIDSQVSNNKDNVNRIDKVTHVVENTEKVVRSVSPFYYLSTSATETIGGEWSADPPEWVEGRYYWQKIRTYYADGTTSDSTPVCITGAKGSDGSSEYIHVKYSDDGRTFTGNILSSDISQWESGLIPAYGSISTKPNSSSSFQQYAAFKTVVSVVPGEVYKGYKKLGGKDYNFSARAYDVNGEYYNEVYGSTLASDAFTIPDNVYYLRFMVNGGNSYPDFAAISEAFTSGEISLGLWSAEEMPGEKLGNWIGTCVNNDPEDPTEFDAYTWKKFVGSDGISGENGIGVKDIATQFYLSTSETELTGGSWVDVMPEWSIGDFLWIRSAITYSDGSVTYTEPICDSSWTAIENVKIGGRNYLRKTNVFRFFKDWGAWGSTLELTSDNFLKITPNEGANLVGAHPPELSTIEAGETYTVSFDAYAENDISISHSVLQNGIGKNLNKTVNITTEPKRYSFTLETTETYTNCSILFSYRIPDNTSSIFYLRNPKLEKGNKATDWTPAPEDTTDELEQNVVETRTYVNELIENSEETTRTMFMDYAKTSDLESIRQNVSTSFTQTAKDFNFRFNTVNERITKENGEIVKILDENSKYIRFVDGNIILGEQGALLTTKIANGRISFLYNDTLEVAYISDQKLYITKAEILDSIVIGNFAFIPRTNGNLSFKKIK